MKKKVTLLWIFVAVLFVSCANSQVSNQESIEEITSQTIEVDGTTTEEASLPSEEDVKNGSVEDVSVSAPSLANNIIEEDLEKKIMVYLPADYETSGLDYPVLYFLPGFGDCYDDYMKIFSKALDSEQVRSMIVVTVDGCNKMDGSFYANSPVTGNWEDYIAKDLVNFMDENYRTLADPNYRGIAGHSMGGTGAISLSMNTNVFGHVYAMSPGLLAPDSFQETSVNFKFIESKIAEYEELSNEEAEEKYLTAISNMNWPINFSFAYASAFAYDSEGKAPYVLLPEKDADGNYLHDEVWEKYDSGFGKLAEKLDEKEANIKALGSLIIDYGDKDNFEWIPKGCEYFSKQLTQQGINHELLQYEGSHQGGVPSRIKDVVIPHFQSIWLVK